ncbi:hypothetical protein ACHAPO_010083 [Fusarium lateritium]
MCVEIITIALCTAKGPDEEPGYCGKFHLVAGAHNVCEEAHEDCMCCFGTCGKIVAASPARIDVLDFLKLPCIVCAANKGELLKNHTVLEPVPVKGSPLPEGYLEQKLKVLQSARHGDSICSHHAEGFAIKGRATFNKPAEAYVVGYVDTQFATASTPAEASSDEVSLYLKDSKPAATDASEHYGEDSVPAADLWAAKRIAAEAANTELPITEPVVTEPVITKPAITEPITIEHAMTESTVTETPFEKDDEPAVGANDNDGETSVKSGSDTGKCDQKGREGGTTPITRRAVNFQYSAEAADKLRDATEKFATLKSGFLMGKAI